MIGVWVHSKQAVPLRFPPQTSFHPVVSCTYGKRWLAKDGEGHRGKGDEEIGEKEEQAFSYGKERGTVMVSTLLPLCTCVLITVASSSLRCVYILDDIAKIIMLVFVNKCLFFRPFFALKTV